MGKNGHDSDPAPKKKTKGTPLFGSPERPPELSFLGRIKPGEIRNPQGAAAPGARRGFIRSRMPEVLELTPAQIEARLRKKKSIPAGEVIALEIARSGCRGVMRAQDQIIAMEPKEVVMDVVAAPDIDDRLDALAAEFGAKAHNGASHSSGANGSGGSAH